MERPRPPRGISKSDCLPSELREESQTIAEFWIARRRPTRKECSSYPPQRKATTTSSLKGNLRTPILPISGKATPVFLAAESPSEMFHRPRLKFCSRQMAGSLRASLWIRRRNQSVRRRCCSSRKTDNCSDSPGQSARTLVDNTPSVLFVRENTNCLRSLVQSLPELCRIAAL